MAVLSYTNPGWLNDSTPALDATNMNAISNALQSLSTGSAWVAPAIGSTYIQFPGHTDPATLWSNSTWVNISSETLLAGRVPRVEGSATYGSAATFGSTQNDQEQGHKHNFIWASGGGAVVSLTTYSSVPGTKGMSANTAGGYDSVSIDATPVSDGTNGTPRVGTETRAASVTIRVWQRTA